jgi:hypothetical protein
MRGSHFLVGLFLMVSAARAGEPERPKIEIGDVSKEGGGFLPPHVSHRSGRDFDVYVFAANGKSQDICGPGYDRSLTAEMVKMFASDEKTEVIFSGDPNLPGTVYWKGLREHVHVRMSERPTRRAVMAPGVLDRARADYETICSRVKSSAPTSHPGDQALIEHATKVAASILIVPSPEIKKPTVAIKGTIAEYVAAVANTNGVGVLGARAIVPCRVGSGRCARIEGSPCASAKKKDGCEGVGLSVTIGFAAEKPILVEAYGPTLSAVRTQADVEKLIELSP